MSEPMRPKSDPQALANVAKTETVHHKNTVGKKRAAGKLELNLTSMLDVCFQLLIFFILTATFAVGEGILPADLPTGGPSATDDEPPAPLNILLSSRGGDDVSIQIQGMATPPTNFSELYVMLNHLQNRPDNPSGPYQPKDPVIIKPDNTVKWGHVVNAFNSAVRARYENVNFAQPGK